MEKAISYICTQLIQNSKDRKAIFKKINILYSSQRRIRGSLCYTLRVGVDVSFGVRMYGAHPGSKL